jgi:hypothetical protein
MIRLIALLVLIPAVAVAEPVERRLHADQVSASSFLWNDWNRFQENYHPLYVSDDDPKTAWVEGVDGDGVGEWLRLRVTEMDGATQLRLHVRNGYQKSPSLFAANGRPKEVTVKLLPSGVSKRLTLEDADGWQDLVVAQPAGKLNGVELRIESVYKGTKYTDTCISDIQVFVTATTRENPAFEKSKLDLVMAWKAERLAAAKLFKQAAHNLPLLPSYQLLAGEGKRYESEAFDKCEIDYLCWIREALARAKGGEAVTLARAVLDKAVPARLAPTDTRPFPVVDGLIKLRMPDVPQGYVNESGLTLPLVDTVAALRADQLGAIQLEGADAKVTLDQALAAKAPGCNKKAGRTYAWMLRDKVPEGAADAGRERVRALLLVRCARVEVRDGAEDVAAPQVAVYDADGRLALTVGAGYFDTFRWKDGVLAGGTAVYASGGTTEMTGPDVAQR